MTASKIAITLPSDQLARVRQAVRRGRASSVSAYIANALEQQDREESLTDLLRDLVAQHGDEQMARAAGELCGAAGTHDVIDATVILTARSTADVVLTGDPDDLLRLDPGIRVERV